MSEDEAKKKSRSFLGRIKKLFLPQLKAREQLINILREAEEKHLLSGETLGTIERILQVSEMQVREIMIPKAQMIVVQQNHTLDNILPIVIDSGHSRFPVYSEDEKEIIGILLAKDILHFYYQHEDEPFVLNKLIRPAAFTPQSKRLDILLREFRVNRNHLAIVLDEYGQVAGLVTIEDVLEQIVGDIEDEYDIEESGVHFKKIDGETYIAKATTLIEDFNDYFHTDLSDDEYDTIGGIVLKSLNHLPKRGEKIKVKNFRFKVLTADNRRVHLLEIKLPKIKK